MTPRPPDEGRTPMRIAIAGATGTVGRHVVEAARDRGHEPVALSRREGVDIAAGDGLAHALAGTDAIVDVLKGESIEQGPATEFFRCTGRNLQRAGADAGVRRIVTLSIVGIDNAPFGFYAAVLAREQAAAQGPVPQATLRATQFHEFPAQQIAMTRDGDRASIFDVIVQTVSTRTVAHALIDAVEDESEGRVADIGGPSPAPLVELARAYAERHHPGLEIVPDTESMAGLAPDALLPGEGARMEGPSFAEWLAAGGTAPE